MTLLTRSQVAEHNANNSAWIIIDNRVFDVTKFLDEHPGGCEVLLEKAGKDGTEAFENVGHSTDARAMKEEFLVGEIVEDEKWEDDRKSSKETGADDDVNGEKSSMKSVIYIGLIGLIAGILYWLLLS